SAHSWAETLAPVRRKDARRRSPNVRRPGVPRLARRAGSAVEPYRSRARIVGAGELAVNEGSVLAREVSQKPNRQTNAKLKRHTALLVKAASHTVVPCDREGHYHVVGSSGIYKVLVYGDN